MSEATDAIAQHARFRWEWLMTTANLAPLRFRDFETAKHAHETGDFSKAVKAGEPGYEECPFEVRYVKAI